MKKQFLLSSLLLIGFFFSTQHNYGQVKIGDNVEQISPYVSSHGQSYLFLVNSSPIPEATVALFPNSSLYSSSQEEPTALNYVNHVQFKFVDLDVTNTSNFRRKIDPRFVMRCIQN